MNQRIDWAPHEAMLRDIALTATDISIATGLSTNAIQTKRRRMGVDLSSRPPKPRNWNRVSMSMSLKEAAVLNAMFDAIRMGKDVRVIARNPAVQKHAAMLRRMVKRVERGKAA